MQWLPPPVSALAGTSARRNSLPPPKAEPATVHFMNKSALLTFSVALLAGVAVGVFYHAYRNTTAAA